MQKFKFNINGKSYEAIVEETERNTARVELNGKSYTVQVEKEEAIVSPKIAAVKPSSSSADFVDAPAQPITGNAGSIKSPLPGNVSKVKVKEGQAIVPTPFVGEWGWENNGPWQDFSIGIAAKGDSLLLVARGVFLGGGPLWRFLFDRLPFRPRAT